MFDTVDDLHLACLNAPSCEGFTTVRMANPSPREMPLCIYLASSASSSSSSIGNTSGSNGMDTFAYPRIFYEKPLTATTPAACDIAVARSGVVAVYIQQTVLDQHEVLLTESNSGRFLAKCGAASPFAGGFVGARGRCGQWAMCFSGSIPANATIHATTAAAAGRWVDQGGCEHSLGVLVVQLAEDAVQVPQTTEAPIARLDDEVAAFAFRRLVRQSEGHSDPMRVFVFKGVRAALDVRQTGYDCGIAGNDCGAAGEGALDSSGASSASSTIITMQSQAAPDGACQSCGGLGGFYQGRGGFSDRCASYQFCGGVMPLDDGDVTGTGRAVCSTAAAPPKIQLPSHTVDAVTSAFSGLVSVSANVSSLRYRSGECTGFDAKLYVSAASPSLANNALVFPLLASDNCVGGDGGGSLDVRFRTLLVVPAGSTASFIHARLGLPAPAGGGGGVGSSSYLIPSIGTRIISGLQLAEPVLTTAADDAGSLQQIATARHRDVYVVHWDTVLSRIALASPTSPPTEEEGTAKGPTMLQSALHANSSQACMVDCNNERAVVCTFVIPRGADMLKLLVAQNDFVASEVTVKVQVGPSSAQLRTAFSAVCGKESRFGRTMGQQDACGVYLPCVERFLFDTAASADNNTHGVVTVTLPATIRSRSCDLQAVVVADFARSVKAAEGCKANEFECPGERRCVPLTSIRDGVQDCNSNADERVCQSNSDVLVPLMSEAFCVPSENVIRVAVRGSLEACTKEAIRLQSKIFTLNKATGECEVYDAAASDAIFTSPEAFVCPDANSDTYLCAAERSSFALCRDTVQCFGRGAAVLAADGKCECACSSGYYGADCNQPLKLDRVTDVVCFIENVADQTLINLYALAQQLTLGSKLVTVNCQTHGILPEAGVNDGGDDASSPNSTTLLRVHCTVASVNGRSAEEYTHFRRLLQPATWRTINGSLVADGQPQLHYITARTAMTPEVNQPVCALSDDGTSAACTVMVDHDALRISIQNSLPVVSAVVQVVPPDRVVSASRSFAPAASSFTSEKMLCTMGNTNGNAGCLLGSCAVLFKGLANSTVHLSDIQYGEPSLLTSTCAMPLASVSAQTTFGNMPLATVEAVNNEERDYTPYLGGAIAIFAVGTLFMWILALSCGVRFFYLRRKAREQAPIEDDLFNHLTPLERIKVNMVLRLAFYKQLNAPHALRPDRWATALAIVGAVLALGASFLVTYYATSYTVTSNFRVMYEEYSDQFCERSTTGYMPRRIFAVPAGATSCERMQTTGEVAGAVFAMGFCDGSGGSYVVKEFHIGGSKTQCRSAKAFSERVSGECIHISRLDASSTRNVYVRLSCSTASLIDTRTAVIQTLTGAEDVFVEGESHEAAAQFCGLTTLNQQAASSPSSPPVKIAFSVDGTLFTSSSSVENTVASIASLEHLSGVVDPLRIVAQSSACTFLSSVDASPNCMDSLERSIAAFVFGDAFAAGTSSNSDNETASSVVDMALSTPSTSDLPIGFLFGGFATPDPITWVGAAPAAQHYYNVAGSAFDIGAMFPPDGEKGDKDGYAVSMWLRADGATQGFAFAVTDGFENTQTRAVYPVERLASIIDSGQGGGAWFNQTYHVYQSLYVNGPGRTLTYAYANPYAEENRVTLLDFNLDDIGATHVMNGQWHHVAIALIVENKKVSAQLILDGQTSYTKAGWSECVEQLPEPISRAPIGHSASAFATIDSDPSKPRTPIVFDQTVDRVTNGGLLVVGYFNGGVYGLRAHPKGELLNTDILKVGTQTMRDANPFPRSNTLALGVALIVISFLLFIFVLITSVRNMRTTSAANHKEYRNTAFRFYYVFKQLNDAASLFGIEKPVEGIFSDRNLSTANAEASSFTPAELSIRMSILQASTPFHGHTAALKPIRYATAIRWTGLSAVDFAELMSEIMSTDCEEQSLTAGFDGGTVRQSTSRATKRRSNRTPAEALALFLYQTRVGVHARRFTAEEWNAVVEKDEATHDKSQTNRLLKGCGIRNSDENADVHDCGGIDVFTPFFSVSSAAMADLGVSGSFSFMRRVSLSQSKLMSDPHILLSKSKRYEERSRRRSQSINSHHQRSHSNSLVTPNGGAEATAISAAKIIEINKQLKKAQQKQAVGEQEDLKSDSNNADDGHSSSSSFGSGSTSRSGRSKGGDAGEVGDQALGKADDFTNFGGGGGGGGGAMMLNPFDIALPSITVFQSVHVWATSLSLPSIYDDYFKGLFSFFSIDVAGIFPSIPTLVTPLVQVIVGLSALGFVMYLILEDNKTFESNVARYVWRRDSVEMARKHDKLAKKLPETLVDMTQDEHIPEGEEDVPLLPVADSRRIDLFVGKAARMALPASGLTPQPSPANFALSRIVSSDALAGVDSIRINAGTEEQIVAEVRKLPHDFDKSVARESRESKAVAVGRIISSSDASDNVFGLSSLRQIFLSQPKEEDARQLQLDGTKPVEARDQPLRFIPVDVFCPYHPHVRLSAQEQTLIWPFSNRPSCCVTSGGVRCGADCGKILSCGHEYSTTELGEGNSSFAGGGGVEAPHMRSIVNPDGTVTSKHVCNFAICQAHARNTKKDIVLGAIAAQIRRLKRNGLVWLATVLAIMLANACYTPLVKNALMIVACHPYYQCELGSCWSSPSQTFILAALLAMAALILYGLGFPLALFAVLKRRRSIVQDASLSPEYKGAYAEQKDENDDDDNVGIEGQQKASAGKEEEEREDPPVDADNQQNKQAAFDEDVGGSEKPKKKKAHKKTAQRESLSTVLSPSEWSRFVASDQTALSDQYRKLAARWLFFPSFMILAKVFVLLPAVLAEPRSLEQRFGCALVELLVAFFYFATHPYVTPIVMVVLRLAEVHQLLLLGLQNLDLVFVNDGKASLGMAMVATTLIYLAFSIVIIISIAVIPLFEGFFRRRRLRTRLAAHGLVYSKTITLYVDPTVDCALNRQANALNGSDAANSGEENRLVDAIVANGGGASDLPLSSPFELFTPTSQQLNFACRQPDDLPNVFSRQDDACSSHSDSAQQELFMSTMSFAQPPLPPLPPTPPDTERAHPAHNVVDVLVPSALMSSSFAHGGAKANSIAEQQQQQNEHPMAVSGEDEGGADSDYDRALSTSNHRFLAASGENNNFNSKSTRPSVSNSSTVPHFIPQFMASAYAKGKTLGTSPQTQHLAAQLPRRLTRPQYFEALDGDGGGDKNKDKDQNEIEQHCTPPTVVALPPPPHSTTHLMMSDQLAKRRATVTSSSACGEEQQRSDCNSAVMTEVMEDDFVSCASLEE